MTKANISIIVKEVLICIFLVIVAIALNYILFGKFLMEDVEVAVAGEYQQIERENYVVVNGNIQDVQSPTQTYEASPSELETYQSEYRYEVGTINPFVSDNSNNDLPKELIGESSEAVAEQ